MSKKEFIIISTSTKRSILTVLPIHFPKLLKKYKKELLSLTGDCGGKKILKKHIENARFFKVLEETELCDIDYPKEMQAMLAKRGKSS